jgi:hypothetical protein
LSTKNLVQELIAGGLAPDAAADFVARAMFLGSQMGTIGRSKHAEAQQRYRVKKLMDVSSPVTVNDHGDNTGDHGRLTDLTGAIIAR